MNYNNYLKWDHFKFLISSKKQLYEYEFCTGTLLREEMTFYYEIENKMQNIGIINPHFCNQY